MVNSVTTALSSSVQFREYESLSVYGWGQDLYR